VCSAVALKKEVTGEAQEVPVERNRGEEEVNYPQMQEVRQKTESMSCSVIPHYRLAAFIAGVLALRHAFWPSVVVKSGLYFPVAAS
jgi:hypothetical protein